MQTTILKITGMTCGGCVNGVTKALKAVLGVSDVFVSLEKAEGTKRIIFEYIEVFYNRIRRHAKINNLSPSDFANQYYINYPIAA